MEAMVESEQPLPPSAAVQARNWMVEAAAGAKVVLVTVRVGRPWEAGNNEIIRSAAARWGNVRVADWYEATEGHGELFHSDGIHVGAAGGQLYATVVAWAMNTGG